MEETEEEKKRQTDQKTEIETKTMKQERRGSQSLHFQ